MRERAFHKEKTIPEESVSQPKTWIFKLKRSVEHLAQTIRMDPCLGTSDSEGKGDIITVVRDERRSSRESRESTARGSLKRHWQGRTVR